MKTRSRAPLALLMIASLVFAACERDRRSPPANSGGAPPAVTSGSDYTYESLVELVGNPDHFAVARTLGERLPALGPGSLPAVKEVLEDAGELELDAVVFELLIRYWGRYEPAQATFYAMTRAPRAYTVAAIHATLRPWAAADPQKALESAKVWTMAEGDPGAATQIALVRGWYDSGKPGLEEYVRDLGEGFARQRAVAVYATSMIRTQGPEAAVRWADSVPEVDNPSYRADVLRGVASALVAFDVEAAQRFFDAHRDDPQGSAMRDRIARRWAMKDGGAAIEWLTRGPESAQRDVAIRQTYSIWTGRSPEKAVQWMKEKRAAQPRPVWIAAITPVYARVLGETEPEDALVVADEIAGPGEQSATQVAILRGWRQRDEAAAERWLQKSSLSAGVLDRVRAPQTNDELGVQEEIRLRLAAPKS